MGGLLLGGAGAALHGGGRPSRLQGPAALSQLLAKKMLRLSLVLKGLSHEMDFNNVDEN